MKINIEAKKRPTGLYDIHITTSKIDFTEHNVPEAYLGTSIEVYKATARSGQDRFYSHLLYVRLFEEFEAFKKKALTSLTPDNIERVAWEISVRSDILYQLEGEDLPFSRSIYCLKYPDNLLDAFAEIVLAWDMSSYNEKIFDMLGEAKLDMEEEDE